jgi:hypothetical protein
MAGVIAGALDGAGTLVSPGLTAVLKRFSRRG